MAAMTQCVAMSRNSRQPGARDLFSCSLSEWRLLQELAISAGWDPHGTTYFSPDEKTSPLALHDYEPGEAADSKCVAQDDAIAWATSLQTVKERTHFLTQIEPPADGDTQADADALATLIAEFIQYAYGGSFAFVRSAKV
jgi:hypothetical protein